MSFGFSALRQQVRRVVHDTMAVPAVYAASASSVTVTDLMVRRHHKLILNGDNGDGYAQMLEGFETIIFDSEELNHKGVTLSRGGRVTLDDGALLILDSLLPPDGPLKVVWRAVQP